MHSHGCGPSKATRQARKQSQGGQIYAYGISSLAGSSGSTVEALAVLGTGGAVLGSQILAAFEAFVIGVQDLTQKLR